MESTGFKKVALLVVLSRHVKRLTRITVNTDDIDAEYEALCLAEGALV